jgi:sterol desaturase/sphingolipid hydroxylase (fatty acid hydroxylase superfamily)
MDGDFGKFVLGGEAWVRLAAFVAVLGLMATLEALWPRRQRLIPRATRWVTNLTFVGLGAAIVRLLMAAGATLGVPLVAVLAAMLAERRGWGLFNLTDWPLWLEALAAIVILDFAIWFQHLAAHRLPWLWVVHRVHHADTEFDVSTALRFHPIEIGLSMLWKVLWVLALGAPAAAVIVFEIILNALAMFNHANFALPVWLDRILRSVIVTPDMHRVHHSVRKDEHHTNFGFNLSIWDRLFGTYLAQPRDGHDGMTIGLPQYQTEQPTGLWWSLKLPFGK